ncbi:MAG TPA: MBL fold metallo-hydrolase [Chloroflexi bacterium]|nr:MBL fold metallo-hydrolase [Chloroflexota bacterium]
MKEIAPNIYVSTEFRGLNVGFIDLPNGVVAIDAPPLPKDARRWKRQIQETAKGPILYLMLTDGHPDRLLGARILADMGQTPILASRPAYDHAVGYTDGFWRGVVDGWVRRYPEDAEELIGVRGILPEILFTEGLTLHKPGQDLDVEQIDGAAPGSAWIHLPDRNVLFVGDTLVVGEPPYMDTTPDTRAWMKTLTTLRRSRFSDTIIVPGRGPLADQSSTYPLSDYLGLARRRVRSMHASDQTSKSDREPVINELLATFSLSEGDEDWARRRIKSGLDRLIEELGPEE